MRSFFLRILVLVPCTFSVTFFGCAHYEDSTPIEVNALDQTKEIQRNLSSEAQQAMDGLTSAQQIPQAVEALNAQRPGNAGRNPSFD